MKWLLEKLGYMLMLLVVIVVARLIGGEMGRSSAEQVATRRVATSAESNLANISSRLNATLPQMVDENIRWDTTSSGPGNTLSYFYSYPEWPAKNLEIPAMQAQLIRSSKLVVCSDSSAMQMLRAGGTINYVFSSGDGVLITRLSFNATDCEASMETAMPADPVVAAKPSRDDFANYPATLYDGSVQLPDFNGRDKPYADFRTRLRDGMKNGANFAGSIAMIHVGCGTACQFVYAGNVATGEVHHFPLGGEENSYMNLIYQPDSRLVIAKWKSYSEDRCYRERLVWNGKTFEHIDRKVLGTFEACDTN